MANEYPSGVTRLSAAMRSGGEFPAMAHTVNVISAMTAVDSTSAISLADTILQDYGLTQKLLRMVNTLGYGQYGEVTTVTRAVMLMGFERVRTVSTSLIIFEHLRKHAHTPQLVELLSKAFCSAVVGRILAQSTQVADAEEAFIGALYNRLGEVLVAFYLPKDYAAIQAVPADERKRKTHQVLGGDFETVGAAIAGELHLPERLRHALTPVEPETRRGNITAAERLNSLAVVANGLIDAMTAGGDLAARRAEMDALMTSYAELLRFKGDLDPLLARAVADVKQSAATFKLKLQGTKLMARIGRFSGASSKTAVSEATPDAADESGSEDLLAEDNTEADSGTTVLPETVLTQGLHEIMSLLVGDYALDDVLRVVLETIYRALGVGKTRVIFLLKNPNGTAVHFRFGFGYSADEASYWEDVPIGGNTDFISQAVTSSKDIIIRNARSPSVAQALPRWLVRKGALDRYVLLLPLSVDRRTLGLFYIDGEKDGGGLLTPTVINHIKLLRGQVVVAIQRRGGRGSAPTS